MLLCRADMYTTHASNVIRGVVTWCAAFEDATIVLWRER